MSELINIDVKKSIHTTAGDIELELATTFDQQKISVIYGASGVGKTTVLRMIAGLSDPDSGYIKVNGNTWFDSSSGINIPARKRSIGFVFQDYALFPNMTVRRNIEFGMGSISDPTKVDEMLKDADLMSLQFKYPSQLSGGQKQRLALIRAFAAQPKLLLLDEPLSALDIEMRIRIQDLIISLKQKYGTTILLVSHDIPEIFKLADHVIELRNSKIFKSGSPNDVFDLELIKQQYNIQ